MLSIFILYILSLVLTYPTTGSLYLLTAHPTPGLKTKLSFFLEFVFDIKLTYSMLIPFAQNSAKVRYFYTFQTDHKPSDNVTIQRHYIVTKFPMLYISYFAHLFCSWKLVFLNLPHLFLSSLHPAPLWQPPVCSLSITLFLFYICSFVLFF